MKTAHFYIATGLMAASLATVFCAQRLSARQTPPVRQATSALHLPLGAPTRPERIVRNFDPARLKVLPKDITADQLWVTMLWWKASIGSKCITCHSVSTDRKNLNEMGKPEIVPYDDSKPEYKMARAMY